MSQANRLKLKKHREIQSKKKYKHGEIQRSGSPKRGYSVRYWNQKTGSWQRTKPAPLIKKVEVKKEKPLTRAEKLKKNGMATWNTNPGNAAYGAKLEDSKMVKKTKKKEDKNVSVEKNKEDKQVNEKKVTPKTENKNTGGGETNKVEKPKPAEKLYAKYRRTKGEGVGKGDTRITAKLKKAGFTETRLAKLRKEHADWKAKRKKKKS